MSDFIISQFREYSRSVFFAQIEKSRISNSAFQYVFRNVFYNVVAVIITSVS